MKKELVHHGVKGMHWGVRKEGSAGGTSRKVRKADAKFEKNANSIDIFIGVHNRAAAYANEHDIDRINNKPEYRGKDFSNPSKLREKYYAEHARAFNKALSTSAKSFGTNASGTRHYDVTVNPDGSWSVHTTEIKHSIDEVITIHPKFDSKGFIVSIPTKSSLAHHGVKGMHWGVRKSSTSVATHPDYTSSRRSRDKSDFGNRGVARINEHLHTGKTHKEARTAEIKRRTRIHTAVVTGVIAAKYAHKYGPYVKALAKAAAILTMGAIAQRAETQRGRDFVAQTRGLPRTVSTGPTYTKPKRGVYNISSM
jgi:hypothetical protein